MPKLIYFSERRGCRATIELDNGDICKISVAQTGVLVRSYGTGLRGALFGPFFGPKLYDEGMVSKSAATAMALHTLFPQRRFPARFVNPVLTAFTNAVWHCSSAAEVGLVLNTAVDKVAGSTRGRE
jgi:hypothetical protein